MVRNYVFLNEELFKEIKKEEDAKEIESFCSVNTMLIREIGQKYIGIIGEILNYKMNENYLER